MGEVTAIQWCDHTFNPWRGCTKAGPGCDRCYAERFDARWGDPHWGPGVPRAVANDAYWRHPVAWNRKHAAAGTRGRVFCASLADIFDNEVPSAWRIRLWDLIRKTPHLDWLLLTKRIGNAGEMLPADWGDGFPNVWLGATVVNQKEADRDVPKLLGIDAVLHFLSVEPMLGPMRLGTWLYPLARLDMMTRETTIACPGVDWVICGGESGPGARPLQLEWASALADECATAGVAFFMKQLGTRLAADLGATSKKGGDERDLPPEIRVREFPLLMGRGNGQGQDRQRRTG